MADKVYKVNTPLQHNGKAIAAGELVELSDKHAAPLVECGAIEEAAASQAKGKK